MKVQTRLLRNINKLFKLPVHPFNLQNDGVKSYSQWQYEKGEDTVRFYLDKTSLEEMFRDKTVLDIGCGAAGKTLYYASQGVKKIYGVDVVAKYSEEAYKLAKQKGLEDKFEFLVSDAANMLFKDCFFDTIIMNDAMEHVDDPEAVLKECYRVLKPGGRLYLNFPPYYHPFGAHLSDAIGVPWVHAFFSDETLIELYKDLVKKLPDGQNRIEFRISRDKNGKEYFSYINRMTIKRFNKILPETSFKKTYYKEIPLRNVVSSFSSSPVCKEFLVKMVVCILEK